MRITAVADTETCIWLQLAGIGEVFPVTSPKDARQILEELLGKKNEIAIIFVTPEIAETNPELIKKSLAELYPIILELPTKEREKDPLKDLIRAAVGIELEI